MFWQWLVSILDGIGIHCEDGTQVPASFYMPDGWWHRYH